MNRQLTRCVDGSEQAECYVAALRHVPAAGLGGGEEVLVQGRIRPHDYAAFGTLGVFAIDAAWRAVNMAPASGRYVAIEGNGIVCITSPCFSWDESVLNRGVVRQVSAIDLTAVTGDPASLLPADGGVLVAAGLNRQVREAEGLGLRFEASQVFVEIAP